MVKKISHASDSASVDAYIAKCPKDVQERLREIRSAIRQVAPDASETTE